MNYEKFLTICTVSVWKGPGSW